MIKVHVLTYSKLFTYVRQHICGKLSTPSCVGGVVLQKSTGECQLREGCISLGLMSRRNKVLLKSQKFLQYIYLVYLRQNTQVEDFNTKSSSTYKVTIEGKNYA